MPSPVNEDTIFDWLEEIDNILDKQQFSMCILTRKKAYQQLEEDDKEEEEMEEMLPKIVGKKPTKKCEETTNKEKMLGIQTTINKTLIDGSKTTKNPRENTLSQGRSHKPQVKS
jgi:hypothetical protein